MYDSWFSTLKTDAMKIKKHLSFTALRKMISDRVRSWHDPRREKSTTHSLHDTIMSGLACMYFQEPSLLQFQTEMESTYQQNNLRTLFDVKTIPSAKAMKAILDSQDSQQFQPISKDIIQRLQRGNQLKQFDLLAGLKVCSIDATQYHTSQSIRCDCCLTANKDNDDKPTRYYHTALQAAIMHPDMKQVIPIGVEPIQNSDGTKKQDCETNAAKRFIPKLRQLFPQLGLIITGDDLFSRQPMIKTVLDNRYDYCFVAKEKSHPCMMAWLDKQGSINEIQDRDKKGRTVIYQWMNNVPLKGLDEAVNVNLFRKKTIIFDSTGKQIRCRTESWITSLEVTAEFVPLFVKGAKTRWKVENECFNTLKNQGYHLTHNDGHGEKHLAFNFYQLTLLAFTLHQIAELCDIAYQACRKMAGSKRRLWEKLRTLINFHLFESLEHLLYYFLDREAFDVTHGYVVKRHSP